MNRSLSKSLIGAGSVFFLLTVGCSGSQSGGGGSTQQQNAIPTLNSIGPHSVSAGSPALTLTATGSGFIGSSVVQWNGSPLTTTYGSSTSLTAQVSASDLAAQGTVSITVVNPTPGGGTSGAQTFTINAAPNPVPTASSLSPPSAEAGSPGLTLTVKGTNFISSSQVQWNGSPLTTTYGSGTSLTAQVPASDLAAQGTAGVTVVNPTPGGGASNSLSFAIDAGGNHLIKIGTLVRHIAWDATHGLLYATLPSTGTNANTIVAINPVTATVGTPIAAGDTPDLLALSSDDSFLYVSQDGTSSIARFNLPALTLDSSYNLPVPPDPTFGAERAFAMAVAPGSPHTIATIFSGGTFIYDDTTVRPSSVPSNVEFNTDSLAWGATASVLYATDNDTGADLFVNTVNSTGVTLAHDYGGAMFNLRGNGTLHFDPVSGNIYSDSGNVLDPANGNLVGAFNLSALLPSAGPPVLCVPDVANNLVFFLGQSTAQFNAASGVTILAFNASTYQLVGTLPIDGISGYPLDFVRWGNAGLAFTMMPNWAGIQSGPIYLLDGSFVSASATPDFATGTSVDALPTLVSMSPQAAAVGSPAVTLNIAGSNFQSGTSVLWNGTALETTVISGSALQATVPPSALAAAGNAVVTVSNASGGSSAGSLAFTITPASPGTTNLLAVNLASLDIAWDSAANQLIAPVWSADPQYPNSMVAVNPATGAVTNSVPVAADPTMARITSDGSYVYTGFKAVNQVTRLALPGLRAPASFSLGSNSWSGPWYALDLQPEPGAPLTTAVILGTNSQSPSEGPLAIYDDGTQLPNVAAGPGYQGHIFDDLQWGADASTLYAEDNNTFPTRDFYTLAVNSSGVTLTNTVAEAFGAIGNRIHFDSTTGYIYDDSGQVINPATAASVGNFNASGLLVPDDTLNRVFILGQTTAQSGTANYAIQSFNQTTFAAVGSIPITGVVGVPVALTRWGTNGLAFVTYNKNASPTTGPAGMLYIISDVGFVSSNVRTVPATPFVPVHGVPAVPHTFRRPPAASQPAR